MKWYISVSSTILIITYLGKTKKNAFVLSIFDKYIYESNNTSPQKYMFIWPEAMKQYVFRLSLNTVVEIRYFDRFIPVVPGSTIRHNDGTVLVSASSMDQYRTGWCRLHTNIRYRQIWQSHQSMCFLQGSLSMSHTHIYTNMLDMSSCIQANDKISTLSKLDCIMLYSLHMIPDLIRILIHWSVPSHYLNQCCRIVNYTIRNIFQWNFLLNSKVSIHENALENVVCKMGPIMSRPQCVKVWCPC